MRPIRADASPPKLLTPPKNEVFIQEIRALHEIDEVVGPDVLCPEANPQLLTPTHEGADGLRLGEPSLKPMSAEALDASLDRMVALHRRGKDEPIRSAEGALVSEARMILVLDHIQRMKQEIRLRSAERAA